VKANAASRSLLFIMTKSVAALILNGLVPMVNASMENKDVMAKLNAKMDLMKVKRTVALKSLPFTMIKNVVANRANSNVPMVTASRRSNTVTVKLNAQMVLMKTMISAALEASMPTVLKSVAATLRLRLLVLMVIALRTAKSVMAKLSAQTNLMRVTRLVALKSSSSTMMLDAAVLRTNSNVLTRCASAKKTFATVLLNAKMDLMKEKPSVASMSSSSTTPMSVAATLILSSHAPMAIVSLTADIAMVKPNAKISLMSLDLQPRFSSRLLHSIRMLYLILQL
jgi:hypothetical protein